MEQGPEGGQEMEPSGESGLEMPQETAMLIGLVGDAEAKSAVEAYRDATMGYLTWLKDNPQATNDEMDDQKGPVQKSLDNLEAHKGKPGVSSAVLGVAFGEVKLQNEIRSKEE